MSVFFKMLEKYWQVFISGMFGTLWLAFVTVVFGTLLGTGIALIKMSKRKLPNFLVTVYVELIRGTPILLQLYFFWIGLPKLTRPLGWEPSNTVCILIALLVNSSAYVAEIIRAGVQAVDKGQTEAARSLGISESNIMKKIIMPQAVKNILPALCNEFIMMVKETSLASVFFVNELMTAQKTVQSVTYRALESLTVVGIIYFVITFGLSKVVKVLERRLAVSD